MVDDAAILRAFGDYAEALLGTYDVGAVLYRLADQVVEVLQVDGAGVLLAHGDDRLAFVAATNGDVAAVEAQQVALAEGPCHQAYEAGEPVVVANLEDDQRWPRYRRAALDRGVRAVLGIPMPVGEQRIGALNVYRRESHDWTDKELEAARVLADMASGYILNSSRLEEATTLAGQLQEALDSRIVVEQAKGILAERKGISPSAAFELVRSHARHNRSRVHTVARQVVEGELDL